MKLLFALMFFSLLHLGLVQANDHDIPHVEIPITHDLTIEAALARDKQLPIMLMFSQDGCSYCEIMKAEFIRPMLISGQYTDKVIIRIIQLDDFGDLIDFDGSKVEAGNFATRYRAYVTPTLIFVDHQGRELSPRLLGVGTIDFFGGDIDDAIDQSLQKVRAVALHKY